MGDPHHKDTLSIVLIEVVHDGGLQFVDAFEHASADAVVGGG
jgi:hypothetical protein